jgi:hypothetical protein
MKQVQLFYLLYVSDLCGLVTTYVAEDVQHKSAYQDSRRISKEFSRMSCKLKVCEGFRALILHFF